MSIPTKFSAGGVFPSFTWPSVTGEKVTPAQGEGWRMIVIYRGAHCPLCKRYLNELESLKPEFEAANISVWALSADPVERAAQDALQHSWTFPLLAGLDEEQMRQLGLYMSTPRSSEETDRNFAEPAVFVLNPEGRVQIVDVSNAPFARPDLKALLGGLKFVMANDYPVRGTAD